MWIATSHNVIGGGQQAGNVIRLEAENNMRIIIIIIFIRLEAENKYENYNYYYYQVGGRESLDVRDQRDVGGHTICRACLPGPVVFFSEGQVYQVP